MHLAMGGKAQKKKKKKKWLETGAGCWHISPNLSLLTTEFHILLSSSCWISSSLILLGMSTFLRMEIIYIYIYICICASCKISDYFDIQSDISCNVRHFAEVKRDPFPILETKDTVKARKFHFHIMLTVLKLN